MAERITGYKIPFCDYERLEQGDRVEFKMFGSDILFKARIEISQFNVKYFVNEHNYDGDKLKPGCERMQFYNPLPTYFEITQLKKL